MKAIAWWIIDKIWLTAALAMGAIMFVVLIIPILIAVRLTMLIDPDPPKTIKSDQRNAGG